MAKKITVTDLVEQLKSCPPTATVFVYSGISEDGDIACKAKVCTPADAPYCKGATFEELAADAKVGENEQIVIIM